MIKLVCILSAISFSISVIAQDKTLDLYKQSLRIYLNKISKKKSDSLNVIIDGGFVEIPSKFNNVYMKVLNEDFFVRIRGLDTTFEVIKIMPLRVIKDYLVISINHYFFKQVNDERSIFYTGGNNFYFRFDCQNRKYFFQKSEAVGL